MIRKRKFEQWQIKYFVKSPLIYYAFLLVFVAVFLFASLSVSLDVRNSFSAALNGNKILIASNTQIKPLDGKLYLYRNRNKKITAEIVTSSSFANHKMVFTINKVPKELSGKITVEITTKKQPLLSRIFTKVGKGG